MSTTALVLAMSYAAVAAQNMPPPSQQVPSVLCFPRTHTLTSSLSHSQTPLSSPQSLPPQTTSPTTPQRSTSSLQTSAPTPPPSPPSPPSPQNPPAPLPPEQARLAAPHDAMHTTQRKRAFTSGHAQRTSSSAPQSQAASSASVRSPHLVSQVC